MIVAFCHVVLVRKRRTPPRSGTGARLGYSKINVIPVHLWIWFGLWGWSALATNRFMVIIAPSIVIKTLTPRVADVLSLRLAHRCQLIGLMREEKAHFYLH